LVALSLRKWVLVHSEIAERQRNIRKECRKFGKGRKYTKAKIVISVTHATVISMRESFRQRREVEIEK